ncbi:hypothetical protein QOZ80_UnG0727030 [Eleusine coracana subsp. coracana]|uniref:F-box domain-containing protein n=1 Tax=Eleusine coracana subsp. coracana TaxID=191504 RepID=A0AAV9FVP2_ELECO|nr:hypothetical protein QOZ80_UnG0727030 [Eleusine coracana subsp. coracana]
MEPWRRHAQPDALSSLPAELLDDILTRLDLRDAVRTSALSRAWRRRWESLTALSLSLLHHHHPGTLPLVVASVLLRHAARISRFTDESEADEWVIQGPNLRSLTIRSKDYQGWQFGELPRLSDATIDLVSYVDEHDLENFLPGLVMLGSSLLPPATYQSTVMKIYWEIFPAPLAI